MNKFIADLHIHSKYSRACSKQLIFPEIYRWCKLKGVTVIATADFTHPGWFEEIKTYLDEDDTGLLSLKKEYTEKIDREIPKNCNTDVRFILNVEISSIYKKNDRVRKVHNVVFAPDLKTVEKFNRRLEQIGNITSDGRPILGLDSRDLLDITLDVNPDCLLLPAHIWTPWFSIFGDKSGFETIEECFEDLSDHIYAIETGLSSDPPMNWTVGQLDNLTIVSNSDAHSPEKIAREANMFSCELTYSDIIDAIKKKDSRFKGTLEFYPQEGKYHHDGHRACNISWTPEETKKHKSICPVCKKRVTVGVSNRVYELATRKRDQKPTKVKPFKYIIPLKEILSEVLEKGVNTKTVDTAYFSLLHTYGNELTILLETPISDLSLHYPILAKAIERMRNNEVSINPGYDGVFGEVNIFDPGEKQRLKVEKQLSMI
jgi:uncharacterized protein (TIGR00375 family)